MLTQETYTCKDCGFEYTENDELFHYNPKTQRIEIFIFLRSTAGIDENSEIKGKVRKTYCKHCNKYIRTFYVTEAPDEDFDIIKNTINKGIENSINYEKERLTKEIYQEIYEEEKNYINRIINLNMKNSTELNIIPCPNCNNEIYEFINPDYPCPKCGGKMEITNTIYLF